MSRDIQKIYDDRYSSIISSDRVRTASMPLPLLKFLRGFVGFFCFYVWGIIYLYLVLGRAIKNLENNNTAVVDGEVIELEENGAAIKAKLLDKAFLLSLGLFIQKEGRELKLRHLFYDEDSATVFAQKYYGFWAEFWSVVFAIIVIPLIEILY